MPCLGGRNPEAPPFSASVSPPPRALPTSFTLYLPQPSTYTHSQAHSAHTADTMAPTALQTGGFILGLLGAAAIIAATGMNNWSAKDRQGDVVTSVYTYKGLWQDCETTSAGMTECRPLYGLLGFSGKETGSILFRRTSSSI